MVIVATTRRYGSRPSKLVHQVRRPGRVHRISSSMHMSLRLWPLLWVGGNRVRISLSRCSGGPWWTWELLGRARRHLGYLSRSALLAWGTLGRLLSTHRPGRLSAYHLGSRTDSGAHWASGTSGIVAAFSYASFGLVDPWPGRDVDRRDRALSPRRPCRSDWREPTSSQAAVLLGSRRALASVGNMGSPGRRFGDDLRALCLEAGLGVPLASRWLAVGIWPWRPSRWWPSCSSCFRAGSSGSLVGIGVESLIPARSCWLFRWFNLGPIRPARCFSSRITRALIIQRPGLRWRRTYPRHIDSSPADREVNRWVTRPFRRHLLRARRERWSLPDPVG